MITNADNLLFHPSMLGVVLTEGKTSSDIDKSETCKKYLIKIFRQLQYGRYYHFTNKYTEKGIKQEDDSITLLSRTRKIKYIKNTRRFTNEWFTGEPDVICLPETVDVKSSWSLDTFPHEKGYVLKKDYFFQGLAYNSLTTATRHTIAYCLVNAMPNLIDREKKSLWYSMGCPELDNEQYLFGCLEIERNMIFDMDLFRKDNPLYETLYLNTNWNYDIPYQERVFEYPLLFDEKIFRKITDRITECRDWMNVSLFKSKTTILIS